MTEAIAISGGGTGGHLKVAKALGDEFHKQGVRLIFLGSSKGQDKAWFEHDKIFEKAYFFDTSGVVNKGVLGKVSSLFNMLKKAREVKKIFKKYKIKKLISVGGYGAAPAVFASILSPKCSLYIHEQNSVFGTLNKYSSFFAKEVFSSYLANSKLKAYPVSKEFFDNARIRTELKNIIFLGGSQGARAINDFALSLAKDLKSKNINIIHQAGKNDFIRVKKAYEKLGVKAEVFDFDKNLVEKIAKADFACARAGASSLWELVASGLPCFFIPFPYAAKNHQYFNAKFLVDKKLAFLQSEKNLSKEYFLKCLEFPNSDLEALSKGLKIQINPNGTKDIVNNILK